MVVPDIELIVEGARETDTNEVGGEQSPHYVYIKEERWMTTFTIYIAIVYLDK